MESVQFHQKPQKPQKLSFGGKMHDVIQISAIQYISLPKETVQPLLNNFNSLAEYNELAYDMLTPDNREAWVAKDNAKPMSKQVITAF